MLSFFLVIDQFSEHVQNMPRTSEQTDRWFCQLQCSAKNDVLVPGPQNQSRTWQNSRVLIRSCNKASVQSSTIKFSSFLLYWLL